MVSPKARSRTCFSPVAGYFSSTRLPTARIWCHIERENTRGPPIS
jgi:hypothetical protein